MLHEPSINCGLVNETDCVHAQRGSAAPRLHAGMAACGPVLTQEGSVLPVQTTGASVFRLGAPGAALLLGNPRLPLLAYDATTKKVRFDSKGPRKLS